MDKLAVRIFANDHADWVVEFERAWGLQCAALSVTPAVERATTKDRCGAALFIPGGAPLTTNEQAELSEYYRDGNLIPIVANSTDASMLPYGLSTINAFVLGDAASAWGERLVDEVIARVWQARTERRIFISYRRKESLGVAWQLHAKFSGQGFDVFLDECSIPRGVEFEREIRWRMNDVDLVVFLWTPDVNLSEAVRQEIEFARLSSIGVLAVVWPGAGASGTIATMLTGCERVDVPAPEFFGTGRTRLGAFGSARPRRDCRFAARKRFCVRSGC